MTPEACTALALALLDARDFVRESDPGNLDAEILDAAVDALGRLRNELVRAGAR